jgi:hypothetical protein
MRVANRDARNWVRDLKPFKGSNTFGEYFTNVYVVYSYGEHFPLFVFDKINRVWYYNEDKYSVSTSKHFTQLNPLVESFEWKTKPELLIIIKNLKK